MGDKKGGNTPAMPAYTPPPESGLELESMMGMFAGLQESFAALANKPPPLPSTPAIQREPEVDWASRNQELLAKAKADYGLENSRRKGRQATVLSSPLAEEEDVSTTASLLKG